MTSKHLVGLVTAFTLALAGGGVYLAWTLKYAPEAKVKAAIKGRAKDPSSVQLKHLRQSPRDTEVWCGEVNARNAMGGMVGFQKFVYSRPNISDDKVSEREQEEILQMLSTMTLEGDPIFPNRYALFCS